MSLGRDLAGWLGAGAVAAALFGGAALAALRVPSAPRGDGAVAAVALELSVGVVSMAAMLPSVPPAMVAEVPEAMEAPAVDAAPRLPLADIPPELAPDAPSRPDLPGLPLFPSRAEVSPDLDAAPLPSGSPKAEPPLDLAQSLRPVARPVRTPETRETVAEAARAAEVNPAPMPESEAVAQAAGAQQAAQPAQRRQDAGGREAARYGDAVMRQIAAQRRAKAPERGVVTVGFEVGGDGGLRRVAVIASSGSAALDQVAVDHIRRAAPFPPPPQGAATRFAFEFVGR